MGFIAGMITGAILLFLVLDNNPKLAAKLSTVKKLVKKEVEQKVKGL
jgi:hypothetical protein